MVPPVPPFATASVPPRTTAPVDAVDGVNPVVPALNDATVFAVVASVPDVGSVRAVVPVAVRVVENPPTVVSVELLASVNVPVVVDTVRPLMLVAVATPKEGVVRLGEV